MTSRSSRWMAGGSLAPHDSGRSCAAPARPLCFSDRWPSLKDCRNRGIGSALVRHALAAARRRGYRAVVLVGDAPYYNRFGFSAEMTAALRMPGPFERHRLLAVELVPGALKGARGLLRAPNRPAPRARLAPSPA